MTTELDPFHSPAIDMQLGRALYFNKQFEEVLLQFKTCITRSPKCRARYMYLAPTFAELGQIRRARETVTELLKLDLAFTIENSAKYHLPFVPDAMDYFVKGLRKAGVPKCACRFVHFTRQ